MRIPAIHSLAISGDKLYAWNIWDKTLLVIDLQSEQAIATLSVPSDVVDIKAVGDILYVLTAKNIFMVDTKTDKVSGPLLEDQDTKKNSASKFVISGDKAYVLNHGGGLEIYDFIAKRPIPGAVRVCSLASFGNLVFIGRQRWQNQSGISIWNSASQDGRELVGFIETPDPISELYAEGDTLYVRDEPGNELRQMKMDTYYLVQ